jgi:hypothetical protein
MTLPYPTDRVPYIVIQISLGWPGACILENTPPPPGEGITDNVIWRGKYGKEKRINGKVLERNRKKINRG